MSGFWVFDPKKGQNHQKNVPKMAWFGLVWFVHSQVVILNLGIAKPKVLSQISEIAKLESQIFWSLGGILNIPTWYFWGNRIVSDMLGLTIAKPNP